MPSLTDWIQVASAIGTVAAAGVGWRAAVAARASADAANKQLPELRKQVEASNIQALAAQRQVELAQQAAQDAAKTAREAVRARADERAPHVIVALREPQWPPYVDQNRSMMPFANDLRLLDPESIQRSTQGMTDFFMTKHANWFMWFTGTGHVVNEGPTAARVRVSGEVTVNMSAPGPNMPENRSPFPYGVRPAIRVGDRARNEYLVAPGTAIEFDWAIGAPIKEWVEKNDADHAAGGEIQTAVWSYGDAGTFDEIRSELRVRPFRQDADNPNLWHLVDETLGKIGIVTYPAKRTWLFERQADTSLDEET